MPKLPVVIAERIISVLEEVEMDGAIDYSDYTMKELFQALSSIKTEIYKGKDVSGIMELFDLIST